MDGVGVELLGDVPVVGDVQDELAGVLQRRVVYVELVQAEEAVGDQEHALYDRARRMVGLLDALRVPGEAAVGAAGERRAVRAARTVGRRFLHFLTVSPTSQVRAWDNKRQS